MATPISKLEQHKAFKNTAAIAFLFVGFALFVFEQSQLGIVAAITLLTLGTVLVFVPVFWLGDKQYVPPEIGPRVDRSVLPQRNTVPNLSGL